MAGKLVAFRVDEETYKKLESMGNPSKVAKQIVIEYFTKEKEREDKLYAIEKQLNFVTAELERINKRQELIESVLRKRGLWR